MKLTLNNLVSAALAASLVVPTAFGQGLEDVEKKLSAVLAKAQQKNRFVGLSVLVIDKDKGSFKKHYGFRDHARTLAPDDDTMYEIGSITKVFARLALAAQDKIKPEDLLSQHLPEGIRAPRPHGEDITIKQLMTHTGSMRGNVPCTVRAPNPEKAICFGFDLTEGAKDPFSVGSRELTFQYVNEYSYTAEEFPGLMAKPGTYLEYSNPSLGLLGELLGVAHGTSFENVLHRTILEPLRMTRTKIAMPCDKDGTCDNLADPHKIKPDESGWHPWVMWHLPGMPSAGGIRSSFGDMEKFLRANMNPDSSPLAEVLKKGQTPLPDIETSLNENICAEGQVPEKDLCNPHRLSINYAWAHAGSDEYFFHGGRTYGSDSVMAFSKDRKIGGVVLSNSSYYGIAPIRHYPSLIINCVLDLLKTPDETKSPFCKKLSE